MLNTKVVIMDGRDNKESSNLLQNSENLSLSDLELPEIEHQRKRKVRRKTRPRLSTNRHRTESAAASGHRNIIFVGSGFLVTLCWLLILSYTMSVIRLENQRLQTEIKRVSVISQNLPEEMQMWHEKSSLLEKNQSKIFEKLSEIQIVLEVLRSNLTKYTTRADIRTEYSKDDKFVADLGAKLEAVSSDIEIIKDHLIVVQKNNTDFQQVLNKLMERFSEISNFIPEKNKNESECLQKLQNVQFNFENQIRSVTANLSVVNDTLTQKAHILNEELLTHKTKLYDLMDKSANITSHVTSIKNDWTKYRQQISDCEVKLQNFENIVSDVVNKTLNFEKLLPDARFNFLSTNEPPRNANISKNRTL